MSTFQKTKSCFTSRSRAVLLGLAGCLILCLPGGYAAGAPCQILIGDVLIIPDGCTYTITGSKSYERVYVLSGGTLNLASGAVLQVSETLYVDPDGVFGFYADDGETRPILKSTGHLDIYGHIEVVDPADGDGGAGGVIARASHHTVHFNLDSRITSDEGPVDITAKFENDGIIEANGANVLISGELIAGSAGMFRISADHTMVFTDASEVIGGNPSAAHFDVQEGTMLFSGTQTTTGGFSQTGGKVQVNATETFSASGAFDSGAGVTP